jgi:hypothetical protein
LRSHLETNVEAEIETETMDGEVIDGVQDPLVIEALDHLGVKWK